MATTTIDIEQMRTSLGSRKVLSRVSGFSERSLAAWEGGKPLGSSSATKMRELQRLTDALRTVLGEEAIAEWLDAPNQAFDNLKPIEVIERGEVDRIWRMIFFLESGVPS